GSGLARLFKPLGRKFGWRWLAGELRPMDQLAHNRFLHEQYMEVLQKEVSKPYARDSKLAEHINYIYRAGATVGDGSTAAAVRYERLAGREVGGKSHSQKAEHSVTFLKNWIQKNPGADQADRNIAERLIRDMQDALDGK
ncbi:hypothetical protein, partial [Streptomyces sp. TM32]|uniref:hypothetical protein n=1 Tax=Streptomyces sp. TM32 TaxID=1652669 RepID=UPI001C20B2D7